MTERAIVGEYPVTRPQLALKRVAIFEANDTARGFANVRHNLLRLNGIRATSSAIGDALDGNTSKNTLQPTPSKNAMLDQTSPFRPRLISRDQVSGSVFRSQNAKFTPFVERRPRRM
jgi:hypothetical protein